MANTLETTNLAKVGLAKVCQNIETLTLAQIGQSRVMTSLANPKTDDLSLPTYLVSAIPEQLETVEKMFGNGDQRVIYVLSSGPESFWSGGTG